MREIADGTIPICAPERARVAAAVPVVAHPGDCGGLSFCLHALALPNRICRLAMNIFGLVLSNAGGPSIMPISPNFWRLHSRL